jgi:hypothetical protein
MADVNKEIALKVTTDTSQTTSAFKSAKDELKQTQKALVEMSLAGKQGTAEFKAMEKRAGQLKDAIGDVNTRVKNLANDTPKLELVTQAATGIAGGFAVAQGAAALFGDENEDVQKAIMKTQAAMSILNGVQSIANVLNKDAALGDMVAAKAKGVFTAAVGASTGALKLFRLALIATGIGAAVVAVGLLVANWDKLTKAVTDFISGSPMLTKVIGFITDGFTKLGRAIGVIPSESEAATKQMIADLEKQQKLLEAAGADTTAIQKRLAELRIQLAKETGKGLAEAEEELTLLTAGQEAKRLETAKQAAEKKAELDKAAAAKAKEAAKAAAQIQLELNQTLEDLQAQNIANEEARALAQLEVQRNRARQQLVDKKASDALLIEFDKQTETQRKAITDQAQADRDAKAKEDSDKQIANAKIVADALQQARIDSIKNEFDRAQAELEIQRQAKIEELTLAGASAEEINAVNQSFADKSVQISKDQAAQQKAVKQAQIENDIALTLGGLQALSDLASAFAGESEEQQKRAFAIQKGVSIAMAIIETYLSASKAYTSQLIPGDPTAPIRAYIAAGIAIAGGLARVAAIKKTQFQSTAPPTNTGGGGGSIPTGGGGGQQPPAAFNPNVTPTNPTGQPNPQGGQNGTTRVIVVESDIRRVTTRVDAAERFATFGN